MKNEKLKNYIKQKDLMFQEALKKYKPTPSNNNKELSSEDKKKLLENIITKLKENPEFSLRHKKEIDEIIKKILNS